MNKKSLVLKTSILILLVFSSNFVSGFSIPVFADQTTNTVVNNTNSNDTFSAIEDEIPQEIDKQVSHMPKYSKYTIFLNLEKKIHGFSGMYIDKNGKLDVYTTDSSIKSISNSTLAEYVESYHIKKGVVIKQSKHSWHKWVQLENIVLKLFDKNLGITMMGVNDVNQTYRIGFTKLDNPTIDEVNKFLALHKIPHNAVELVETGKIVQLQGDDSPGLTPYVPKPIKPIAPGAEIGLLEPVPAFNGYTPHCTLGLIAKRSDGSIVGVTAGHCQDYENSTSPNPTQWDNGKQQYLQPYATINQNADKTLYLKNLGRGVGHAIAGTTRPIGSANVFNYSDTVLLQLNETANFGKINNGVSNKTIVGKFISMVGSPVWYMGATTGSEKSGTVLLNGQYVCHKYLNAQCIERLSDQVVASMNALGGDSGSPVYSYPNSDPTQANILFAGTVWARSGVYDFTTGKYTTGLTYSSIQDIESDQGQLNVRNPPPPLSLSSNSGPSTGYLSVSGSIFVPYSTITINFDNSLFDLINAGASGSFSTPGTQISSASSSLGVHTVSAVDQYGNSVSATFTITSSPTYPTTYTSTSSGHVGDPVNISGTGFPPSTPVNINLGGNNVAAPTTDSQGAYNAIFSVPALPPGNYQIQSTASGNPPVTSSFQILSQNTCAPPSSGDWIQSSSCTMSSSAIAPANVIIPPNVVLTIPNGVTLTIHFGSNHLLVQPGGQVFIQPSGKLSS